MQRIIAERFQVNATAVSPHPPQCAHWGTFPSQGKAWRLQPSNCPSNRNLKALISYISGVLQQFCNTPCVFLFAVIAFLPLADAVKEMGIFSIDAFLRTAPCLQARLLMEDPTHSGNGNHWTETLFGMYTSKNGEFANLPNKQRHCLLQQGNALSLVRISFKALHYNCGNQWVKC